jgi:RND superfamily putative drug exporter
VIVAVSFLTLSSTPNQLVRIVASALAVGILLDAVIVRTLLVPALISLMGRWNWWLPAPLARVLRVSGPRTGAAMDESDEAIIRS